MNVGPDIFQQSDINMIIILYLLLRMKPIGMKLAIAKQLKILMRRTNQKVLAFSKDIEYVMILFVTQKDILI